MRTMSPNFLLVFLLTFVMNVARSDWTFEGSIFCYGRLLHDVQTLSIFRRQRDFLELSMRRPEEVIKARYRTLRLKLKINEPEAKVKLREFIKNNFVNSTLVEKCVPVDWKSQLGPLAGIPNKNAVELALFMNRRLAMHCGRAAAAARVNASAHTLIPLPHNFFSSSRRELVYEESWWAVEAHLAMGMVRSAKTTIENLIYLAKNYGHVPAESRIFFLNRAAPPFLPFILQSYLEATNDTEFVKEALPFAEKDFLFWAQGNLEVIQSIFEGYLVVVDAPLKSPRPEHYKEDWEKSPRPPPLSWPQVSSVVWTTPPSSRISVRLTSITEWSARTLANLTATFGENARANTYLEISDRLSYTIGHLLYSKKSNTWKDFDADEGLVGPDRLWPVFTGLASFTSKKVTGLTTSETALLIIALVNSEQISLAKPIAVQWLIKTGAQSDPNVTTASAIIRVLAAIPDINIPVEVVPVSVHRKAAFFACVLAVIACTVFLSRKNYLN